MEVISLSADVNLLPGSVVNVKEGELVTVVAVSRLLGKLGGLMICRLSREQLAETFVEDF